jgi:hypothetical protein
MIALNTRTHARTHTGPITLKIKVQIPLANLLTRSALPMSPSIAINPVPSTYILNTMAIGYSEILSLTLQVWVTELVTELVSRRNKPRLKVY